MSNAPDSLTITNGDLWLAVRGTDMDPRTALANILKVPQTVLAVRNGSTLRAAVHAAVTDIAVARDAALEQTCPECTETEGGKSYVVTPAFREAEATLMAEVRTLSGVRAMKLSEFAQGVYVSPEDVARCGPLLTD